MSDMAWYKTIGCKNLVGSEAPENASISSSRSSPRFPAGRKDSKDSIGEGCSNRSSAPEFAYWFLRLTDRWALIELKFSPQTLSKTIDEISGVGFGRVGDQRCQARQFSQATPEFVADVVDLADVGIAKSGFGVGRWWRESENAG